jgi:hypothetical protein
MKRSTSATGMGVRALIEQVRPNQIIHTAAQPSHDRAAAILFLDFEVNVVGTLNLMEAARRSCPESPFIHMSTNKVYGDRPNSIALRELETRWDYADSAYENGIPEEFSIDQLKHSLFGASKIAGDVMVQEYGRYFNLPTCCLRGGCLTGPNDSGVELHGFLSYLIKCNVESRELQSLRLQGQAGAGQHPLRGCCTFHVRVLESAARGSGLQSRWRKGQRLLRTGSLPQGRRHDGASYEVAVRRRESHRGPHLLLQRHAEDEGALPGVGAHQIAG